MNTTQTEIERLIAQVQAEAGRESFPIDTPVYTSAKLDPTYPILYAGNLKSSLCFFGRDLGRDEVYARQPLYGAAGTLVRQGFFERIYQREAKNKKELEAICDRVLLSNTVPYKPPGNKAYTVAVKNRFRPFIEKLLVLYWQGSHIITLGNEAFDWYSPYGEKGQVKAFSKDSDRFTKTLDVNLTATDDNGKLHQRQVTLMPLPHPSPLNQRYYEVFPQMLLARLNQFEF